MGNQQSSLQFNNAAAKNSPYWLDAELWDWCRRAAEADANKRNGSSPSSGGTEAKVEGADKQHVDSHFDVLIIGAGIAGVSVAHHLRKRGFNGTLALVDERGVAQHASGRNGGHCWPMSNAPSSLGALDDIAALARELNVPFKRNGGLDLLQSDAELKCYAPQQLQSPCELWDANRIARELPILRRGKFKHAVFQPSAAHMSTPAFVRAMFDNIAPTLTMISKKVVSLDLERGVVEVQAGACAGKSSGSTGSSELQSEHIVLATNALTSRILSGVPIQPVRGQSMHLEITDESVELPTMAINVSESFEYAQRVSDRGLVYGGLRLHYEEFDVDDDASLNAEISERTRWRLYRTFKLRPEQYTVTHEWSGIMGFTPDEEPMVGRIPEWTDHFMTCGFSGQGVIKGFAAGRMIAALLCADMDINEPSTSEEPAGAAADSPTAAAKKQDEEKRHEKAADDDEEDDDEEDEDELVIDPDVIPLHWKPGRLFMAKRQTKEGTKQAPDVGKRTVRLAKLKSRRKRGDSEGGRQKVGGGA